MNITKSKIVSAKKVVIYNPEGIGKSTLSAQFTEPLFIDTKGSTKELDVARMDKPSSWAFLNEQIDFVIKNKPCMTLVIDTVDWAEALCIKDLCERNVKKGIEDFGYGKGSIYEKEDFGKFLNKLSDVISEGINVVLTVHACIRKFEQPDELDSYDRYEMKLGQKTGSAVSPIVNGELIYNDSKCDCMSGSEQLKIATAIVRKLNSECGFVLLDKLEQMDNIKLKEFGNWLAGYCNKGKYGRRVQCNYRGRNCN